MINQRFKKMVATILTIGSLVGLYGGTVHADVPVPIKQAIVLNGKTYGNQGVKPANSTYTITVPSDKYQTIQSAIDAAKEGTTIIIKEKSGGYNEQLKINKKKGITLKGEGNAKICGTEEMTKGDLLEIKGSDIVIENLDFSGLYLRAPSTSESCGGIRIKPGSNNVYILNCKIHDLGCIYNYTNFSDKDHFNGHGISIKGDKDNKTSNITIDGCEVYNLTTGRSESVVLNNNTEYFTLSNNCIHDNDNIGIDCAGGYGDTKYDDNRTRNGEVYGNYVKNISSLIFKNPGYFDSNGKPHSGADGIYVDGGKDIYIHDNYVTGCDIGLEIASENHGWTAEGVIAQNNLLIYNDQYVGLAIGGSSEKNGVATGNTITNNTIINSGEQHCLVVKVATGNVIKNNIMISDANPRNSYSYYDKNDITDNASNKADKLPGTNVQISLDKVVVDEANKKVEIKTSTDISNYGYKASSSSEKPTSEPTSDPSSKPTSKPITDPANKPTQKPTTDPTSKPTSAPSNPTSKPTNAPANSTDPKDQIRAFVERLYTEVLGRDPEKEGADFWYNELYSFKVTGAQAGLDFVLSKEFKSRNVSDDEFLNIMYATFFDREADADGFNYWKNLLKSGDASRETVAKCFINSQEWSDICAVFGIRSGSDIKSKVTITPTDKTYAFVERMYTTAFGRAFDPEGREYWAKLLANFEITGEKVGAEFFLSPEMEGYNFSNEDFVNRLYLTFMDREADTDGLNFWVDILNKGATRQEVVYGFTRSPEFEQKCIESRILPC